MTDEIITPQEGMNPEPEVVEVTEPDLVIEDTVSKAQFNQVLARAKKAEEDLRKLNKPKPQTTNQDLSDELKLIARGLSDEEIEKAKVIAKGNGTSLVEALKDDMFITYQNKIKEDKRREDAKLGGASGSGESSSGALVTPTMTREEHQAIFKKVHGLK